ncbi:MAG: class I SAM-dependent methyltransferase [Dehalococcoidia bacterium]
MDEEASSPEREIYIHRDNPSVVANHRSRTAAKEAAFFLLHLRPGMRLLDCGCGPGTITLGLAEAVSAGEAIGVDLEPRRVEEARLLAATRGISNVRFAVGNLYELPFPDASFDAAFAHAVLMHLRDPLRVLREMRRVLRPGGVAGISDGDWSTGLLAPSTPLLETMRELEIRVRHYQGGNVYYARNQRRLLLEAGFSRTVGSVSCGSSGTVEATRRDAASDVGRFRGSIAPTAISQGWANPEQIEAMCAEMLVWGERPDAFSAGIACEAVGWVGETG